MYLIYIYILHIASRSSTHGKTFTYFTLKLYHTFHIATPHYEIIINLGLATDITNFSQIPISYNSEKKGCMSHFNLKNIFHRNSIVNIAFISLFVSYVLLHS